MLSSRDTHNIVPVMYFDTAVRYTPLALKSQRNIQTRKKEILMTDNIQVSHFKNNFK